MGLADGSNISLGYGIGLQKEFDYSALNDASKDIFHAVQARKQRVADAKKKADDDLRSLGVKAPVVFPIYQNSVDQATNKFGNTLFDLSKSNDPDYLWKGKEAQSQLEMEYNPHIESSKQAERINQARFQMANNKNYELSDFGKEFLTEFDKSIAERSPTEGLKKLTGNDQGFISTSVPEQLYKPRKVNLTEYAPRYAKALGLTSWTTEKDKGDVFEKLGGKGMTPQEVKEDIKQTILAGDPEGKSILETYGAGVDVNAATEGFYNLVKGKIPSSSSQSLKQKYVPGFTKEDLDAALATKGVYNLSSAAGGSADGKDETGKVESKGTLTFKPTNATIMLPSATVNVKTNTNVNTSGVNKAVNLGQMDNLPVFVKGPLKGRVIDDAGKKELERLGKWNKGFVKYETFLSGSGVDKEPSELKEGEVSETVPLLIPARGLEGSLKGQKVDLPIGKFLKSAEKYTNELPDEAKSAKEITVTAAQADEAAKKYKMKRIDYLKAMKAKGYSVIVNE